MKPPGRKLVFLILGWLCAALLLQSCQSQRAGQPATPVIYATPALVTVSTTETPLVNPSACAPAFAPINLSFSNGNRFREILTYDSNGTGVAAGDLDQDGLLDLVFASADGANTILWNQGGLKFKEEALDDRFGRGVSLVDLDGDSQLDIVFTHRSLQEVTYWRNQGAQANPRFVLQPLEGVSHPAYAMGWADLNGDGSLDLVTGSYNVDLKIHGMADADIQAQCGVWVYTQKDGQFSGTRLVLPNQKAEAAQVLSIGLLDLDGDDRLDIWAANDFAMPDGYWSNRAGTWQPIQPFKQTAYSTMSIEWGDLDNNGQTALFATDMNPGTVSTYEEAKWLPVLSKLEEKHGRNDPQIMANVLQVPAGAGKWRNEAPQRGVDATGWSWSARFSDLNNDGRLDLYIVNGMIAANLFGHLTNSELVEENRAFRNTGLSFTPAPEWGLGSKASGRGMITADLDNDGRLEIVINNLRGQSQLFANQLCEGGATGKVGGGALEVELAWPGSGNTYAIGAQLALHTSQGTFQRDVRASGGYLSGDPARVHFGLPKEAQLQKLVITYPDGAQAQIENLNPQTLLKVTR